MDFEEFRKKKMQQKKAAEEQKEREAQPAANGEKLDFIDGFGPAVPPGVGRPRIGRRGPR